MHSRGVSFRANLGCGKHHLQPRGIQSFTSEAFHLSTSKVPTYTSYRPVAKIFRWVGGGGGGRISKRGAKYLMLD